MNDETPIENEQDLVKKIERPGSNIESKAEDTESSMLDGAEILETPPDGNYIGALRAFLDKFKDWLGKK